MLNLTDLRAFAYRLAAAALRVGVVLGVVLPIMVLAARPWRTAEQVANESSGKRPSGVQFMNIAVSGVVPFDLVGSALLPCTEVALFNNSTVDVCLSWIQEGSGETCAANAVNCDLTALTEVWLLKAGSSFVTRYPRNDGAASPDTHFALCGDPYAASGGLATDRIFISCLQN